MSREPRGDKPDGRRPQGEARDARATGARAQPNGEVEAHGAAEPDRWGPWGPPPAGDTPIWEMSPYWGCPTGAVDHHLRGRRVHVRSEEAFAPDAPLFPHRPESVYRLRRSERAYAVLVGQEEVAAHAGHRVFVLPAHRRRGVGFALTVALLRERPYELGWRFTPDGLRLHQRAYRFLVLEALAGGGYVHPQALALLRVLQDGQKVVFPEDEERFDITPIDMLPGFQRTLP